MSRIVRIAVGLAVLVGVVIGGGLLLLDYLSGEDEASTDIENVVQQIDVDENSEIDYQLFEIVSAESVVRFYIDEKFSGQDVTVVGETNQVGGQILLTPTQPDASQIGVITINVRTLETETEFPGDDQRDQAIRAAILNSGQDEYEFTDFVPTEITGMPDAVTVGEAFSFQVTGDLTLVDTTRAVTFDMEVTPVSETRIEGIGATVINYPDFGIDIPFTPAQISDIQEDVRLEIEFVAVEVEADADIDDLDAPAAEGEGDTAILG